MIRMAAGVNPLLFGLMFDADEGCPGRIAAIPMPESLDIADNMRGARHRGQNQRPGFQQALHANRQNGVILVDDRCDIQRIGLAGLARHPVDALRLVEPEPGLELSRVEQFCLLEQKQLDTALCVAIEHHVATAVMWLTQVWNCTRIGISLAAPDTEPSWSCRSLPNPREKSTQGPASLARPCWQRSSISTSSEKIIEAGEPSVVRKRTARWNISSGAPFSLKQYTRTIVRSTETGMVTRI